MPAATVFNPPQPLAAAILDDLCNPSLSLEDLALAHDISLDALTAWMTRQDIQERLATLANSAALRARLLCTLQLQTAVHCITTMLKGYQSREHNASRETPEAITNLEHQRTNARRAAALLLRIARFHFELHPRASAPLSRPPGEVPRFPRGGEGLVSSQSTSPQPHHAPALSATTIPPSPAPSVAPLDFEPSPHPTPPIPPTPALSHPSINTAAAPQHSSADSATPRPAPTPAIPHPPNPTPPTSPSPSPPNLSFAALSFADLALTSGP